MKNKTAAFSLSCLFFVYVLLSMFNSLYWSSSYKDNVFIENVGGITDGEALEVIWIPGQFVGFFLSLIADQDLTITSSIITFLIGILIIMRMFKVSWSDLHIGRRRTETK